MPYEPLQHPVAQPTTPTPAGTGEALPVQRRVGRPSKFTPEVRDKVVTALRGGNYRGVAARYAGVAEGTLFRWLAYADDPDADPEFKIFRDQVEKAEADAEVADIALIRRSAQEGQWQAAAWIRERRNPERWGRRERTAVELSGPDGGPVRVEGALSLDAEVIEGLAAALQRRVELGSGDVVDAEVVE